MDENKEYRELVLENGKRILEAIDNHNRIEQIEKYLFKHRLRYKILDFFLILNAIDTMMKSIFSIGIVGLCVCIYRYIISLF